MTELETPVVKSATSPEDDMMSGHWSPAKKVQCSVSEFSWPCSFQFQSAHKILRRVQFGSQLLNHIRCVGVDYIVPADTKILCVGGRNVCNIAVR